MRLNYARNMSTDTKTRIMDTAEALFGAKGFNATSLRAITQSANVNLAAVNYHFGGKLGLLEAVYRRRIAPMNRERLKRLSRLKKRHRDAPIPLPELVRAFVEPALALSRDPGGGHFVKLLGRSYMEPRPVLQDKVREMFAETSDQFVAEFTRTLTHLSSDELYCRMHFMVGVLAYCMTGADMMRTIASSRFLENASSETLITNLVGFICNGMAAPGSIETTISEETSIESNVIAMEG